MDTTDTPSYPSRVSGNIRAEIARRRLTQGEVAEIIGKSVDSIGRRYNGKLDWTLAEIAALAQYLGIDPAQLTK